MSADMTVVQLERMLERKRTSLDGLVKRRERLQKQLTTVEGRIGAIGGVKSDHVARCRGRRRPRNAPPLVAVVIDVLSKHSKGMTPNDLAANILTDGYKTFSDKI